MKKFTILCSLLYMAVYVYPAAFNIILPSYEGKKSCSIDFYPFFDDKGNIMGYAPLHPSLSHNKTIWERAWNSKNTFVIKEMLEQLDDDYLAKLQVKQVWSCEKRKFINPSEQAKNMMLSFNLLERIKSIEENAEPIILEYNDFLAPSSTASLSEPRFKTINHQGAMLYPTIHSGTTPQLYYLLSHYDACKINTNFYHKYKKVYNEPYSIINTVGLDNFSLSQKEQEVLKEGYEQWKVFEENKAETNKRKREEEQSDKQGKKETQQREFLLGLPRLEVKTEEGSWRKVSPSLGGSAVQRDVTVQYPVVHFEGDDKPIITWTSVFNLAQIDRDSALEEAIIGNNIYQIEILFTMIGFTGNINLQTGGYDLINPQIFEFKEGNGCDFTWADYAKEVNSCTYRTIKKYQKKAWEELLEYKRSFRPEISVENREYNRELKVRREGLVGGTQYGEICHTSTGAPYTKSTEDVDDDHLSTHGIHYSTIQMRGGA